MTYVDVQFAGRYFKLDAAGGTDQVVRDIVSGGYEVPLPMMMMASLVRTDGLFIDVGANTGLYPIMAAVISPRNKVIAFEPLPSVIPTLRKNIKINLLESVVDVREIALSNRPGVATLHIPDPGHGLLETSASLEAEFKVQEQNSGAETIEVKVSTLDSLDIRGPIAVIKVDIEGHEYAFLDGAKSTISRERPIIFLEVLDTPQRARLGGIAQEMSYINFRLRPDLAIHDGG